MDPSSPSEHLLRLGFRFETPDAGADAGATDASAEAAGETAAPEPVPAAPWANSPEFSRAVSETVQAELQALLQASGFDQTGEQQQPQGPPALPEDFDLYDPQQFLSLLHARDEHQRQMYVQEMEQRFAPLIQREEHAREQELAELRRDAIHDAKVRNGVELDDSATGLVEALARADWEDLRASNPAFANERAAERVIEQRVTQLGAMLKAAGDAAVERYKNELAGITGGTQQTASGTQAVETIGEYDTIEQASQAFLARNGLN